MPVTILVGCQWGDEGKGKIVDYLASSTDWVARYSGGPNAGHTVCLDDKEYILHIIPSGILRPNVRCVIGHGTVVDAGKTRKEIEDLRSSGVDISPERLYFSDRAHVILPHYLDEEERSELAKTVGTTKKGIGIAYQHKAKRTGFRLGDLCDPAKKSEVLAAIEKFYAFDEEGVVSELTRHFEITADEINEWLSSIRQQQGVNPKEVYKKLMDDFETIKPYIADTRHLLIRALKNSERVLCEGAQGHHLDIDVGTYPFVTSSSPVAGGALTGLGIPYSEIEKVIGVAKAYTTRVGNGPFPTEMNDDRGEARRKRGKEFGATTGRPRRVGWQDLVVLRDSVMSGVDELALTKLDILTGEDPLLVCDYYVHNGNRIETMPSSIDVLENCEPHYFKLKGWNQSIENARTFSELPSQAQHYVSEIQERLGPITLIGVGQKREQIIEK